MGYFFNGSFSRFSWAHPCTDRQTDIRPRYVQHRLENAALRVDDAAWNTADGDCRRKSNARWGLHVSTQPISHGVQMRCPVGVITSLKNATRHPTRIAYSASGSSESRQPNVDADSSRNCGRLRRNAWRLHHKRRDNGGILLRLRV